MKIGIPGIPCGNFASVVRMIEKCGGEASIVVSPAELSQFEKIVIAGVGAFDFGMESLHSGGWVETLNDAAQIRRIPVLGICLGMQLMCLSSDEGKRPGLGWLDADVKKFAIDQVSKLKVPHMGWNTVSIAKDNPLISKDDGEQRFYFVHSYHAVCRQRADVLAIAHHGYDFDAAFARGNIYGVQFHPEKSHRFGAALIKRFVELQC